AHEINRSPKNHRPRIIPCRRHPPGALPRRAFGVEPENLVERRFFGLRFPTEDIDRAAIGSSSGCSARFDRRSFRPSITDWLVNLDVAKISRSAASADRIELPVEGDGGRTSPGSRQRRALRPAIRRWIVLGMI